MLITTSYLNSWKRDSHEEHGVSENKELIMVNLDLHDCTIIIHTRRSNQWNGGGSSSWNGRTYLERDTPIRLCQLVYYWRVRQSICDLWSLSVAFNYKFWLIKIPWKLGCICNWGHWFEIWYQIWPLRLFWGCSGLRGCQKWPHHIRNMHMEK